LGKLTLGAFYPGEIRSGFGTLGGILGASLGSALRRLALPGLVRGQLAGVVFVAFSIG
jgi:hypothetical protein